MLCAKCGAVVAATSKYCVQCGTAVPPAGRSEVEQLAGTANTTINWTVLAFKWGFTYIMVIMGLLFFCWVFGFKDGSPIMKFLWLIALVICIGIARLDKRKRGL